MSVEISLDVPETFNMASLLVDRHVEEGRGDRIALYHGDQTTTYAQLQRAVNKAGNMLLTNGVEVEDRVILLMADRPQFIEAYVGAMKIGAVPVPINVISTPDELAYYINDSRAAAMVLDASLVPLIEAGLPSFRFLKRVFVFGSPPKPEQPDGRASRLLSYEEEFAEASDQLTAEPTSRDDPSYWLYSSGTTGQPKGTVHLHRDMVHCSGTWLKYVGQLSEGDVSYSASKLPFSYGLGNTLYGPLLAGTSCVLVPEASNAQVVAANLKRYHPTLFFSVPTLYNLMLRERETGNIDLDLSTVRMCVSAGEALPPAIFGRWRDAFGIEILDAIGSTEFGYFYVHNLPGRTRAGSSGELLPGYSAKIVDEEENLVADGEIGELYVQSESFAAHYWRKRERTRDTFRGPWMKTGDRYTRDADGYYYYAGRGDDMFKTGAQWVSPIEVEGVLLQHPAVAEVGVVGRQDSDGLTKPVAHVVLKNGHQAGPELIQALQDHSKELLAPDYYKYPRWVEFVTALPKTATGKIQRYKLRAG